MFLIEGKKEIVDLPLPVGIMILENALRIDWQGENDSYTPSFPVPAMSRFLR